MGTNILLSLIVGVAMTAIVGSQIGPNYIEQIKIKKVQTKTINNQNIIFEGIKRYVTIKQVEPNSLQEVINAGYLDPNVNDNGFNGNYAIVVDKAKGVATITTTITDTSVHEAFLNSFTNMSKPSCTGVISNKVCSTNTFKTTFVIPNEVMHGNALLMTGVPIQATPPDSNIYKYWYDTSSGKAILKIHDGSSWKEVQLGGSSEDSVKLIGNQTIEDIKTFTSSPKAPTPLISDNSTNLATTAFVQSLMSGSFSQDLNRIGYVKFPNGFIIQWGYVFMDTSVMTTNVTFKTRFPSMIVAGIVQEVSGAPSAALSSYTQSGLSIKKLTAGPANSNFNYFWVAIGY
ncbi:hypothetical protein O8C85_05445 [Aliarcobacter butzleri]|uniref:gp53-like domain-containing protein n=1 Tax=Aliarcobacter butzleri TaxID=28197 RepID=UPI00263E4E69|nr:hypothetical protein [Aliarcobacter butzleri]MDN5097970.1 hypothetical protein [Aliarcobacter butzleri]